MLCYFLMKIESQYPFEEYACYKNFHKKMQRWQVCLIHKDGHRKTILYSKYKMCIHLGRILSKEEEVDHIDGDKLNDDIKNLEVVTKKDNRRRQYINNKKELIEHRCPQCTVIFYRDKRRSYQVLKFGKKLHCSKKCAINALKK